jgi:hypothetical protein
MLGAVAVAFSLLAWWLVYGGRTQWELHRQGAKVFVVGESESTVTMIGSTNPVHVSLSVGCEDGKDFIHLSPVPVLPMSESGRKTYAVTFDEMFYLHRTDSGHSHVVRNTGWSTIPPSVVTLERLDEPDRDPALGRPTPMTVASNVPRFAHRLSESGLYVLNGGSINLAFGTDGLRDHMPELRTACGW